MGNDNEDNNKPKISETLRALGQFTHIGITMAACVLAGVLLGKYLDKLLGSSPWMVLIFSLLGAGAAIKAVFNISEKNK